MEHALIFELDFVCPSCNTHTSICESTIEVVEDKIYAFELFSWEYDENENITDVRDTGLEVATSRVNSYGNDSPEEWFCANCHWCLPVSNRGELFMWLYHNKMLIPK